LERPGEVVALEPLDARPEADVPRGRVLGLEACNALDGTGERQLRALEQKLSCQQGAIQLALREDTFRARHGSPSYSPPMPLERDDLDRYAEEHTSAPEPLLAELAAETQANLPSPQMLTGTVEGRFLELLVYASGAKRVLEIGMYSGYSALSMAAGLTEGGHIDTCEIEERHAEVARRYIERSPYADRIQIHMGPALESIERLEGDFDFVFIDADKPNYLNYYEAVLPRLGERGFIAADNTLWSGRVLEEGGDESTLAIKEFNDRVKSDPRVTAVMLTVRDGVTLIRPKGGT
jgi:caffeoyl-CoA O-methyltransferase